MSNPKALYNAAIGAYEEGKLEDAERLAKKLVSEYPSSNLANAARRILRALNVSIEEPGENSQQGGVAQQSSSASEEAFSKEEWDNAPIGSVHEPSGHYTTTRTLASLFSLVGWVIVALGVVTAFSLANGTSGFLIGVAIACLGLGQVMGGQLIRATVDTADNTLKILHALKNTRLKP
jgi:hypothetical protein